MQVSIAGFVYCVQILSEQRLPRAALTSCISCPGSPQLTCSGVAFIFEHGSSYDDFVHFAHIIVSGICWCIIIGVMFSVSVMPSCGVLCSRFHERAPPSIPCRLYLHIGVADPNSSCARAVSREYRIFLLPFPCMSCRFSLSFLSLFIYCVRIVSEQRLSRAASSDLEDCLDLAIRKGKAVGETKPTESNRAIKPLPVSIAYIAHFLIFLSILGR